MSGSERDRPTTITGPAKRLLFAFACFALTIVLVISITKHPEQVRPGSIVVVDGLPGTYRVVRWDGRAHCWALCRMTKASPPGWNNSSTDLVERHRIRRIVDDAPVDR